MKWIVASLADGATHLGIPAEGREPVRALCGARIYRPLAILKQDPDKAPPDAAQACPACVRLRAESRRRPTP